MFVLFQLLLKIQEDVGSIKIQQGQIQQQLATANVALAKILEAIIPPPPKTFKITLIGQIMNKKATASLDFQLADNGTAAATITFIDAAGLPTTLGTGQTASVPTWTPSSAAIVVTPAANGLSATVAPATPPVLATDVTITVSAITVTNADSTTISLPSVTSEGIDVVGSAVAGFSISL